MTKEEMKQFCDSWLPCWEGGVKNVDNLLSHYAEDAELIDPNHQAGYRGHKELREFFHLMLETYPDWKFRIEELTPTDEGFVFIYIVDIPYRGKVFKDFRGVDVMKVNSEGKVTSHKGFYDRTDIVLHKNEMDGGQ